MKNAVLRIPDTIRLIPSNRQESQSVLTINLIVVIIFFTRTGQVSKNQLQHFNLIF